MNRTVQWRCPSALPPSGTGNKISWYLFSVRQSVSKLSLFSLIEKVSYFSRHGKVQASLLCSWLIEKFQIFTAVHKSNVLNSATKLILSNLSPNLSAYGMIFRLLGLLNTNISNDTNIFSRGSYSVFNTHTDRTDLTDLVRGGALTGGLNTSFFWTRITRMTRILFAHGGAERNVDFWMLNVELLRLAAMWNCSMMNIDAHMVAIERKRHEWDKYGFDTEFRDHSLPLFGS